MALHGILMHVLQFNYVEQNSTMYIEWHIIIIECIIVILYRIHSFVFFAQSELRIPLESS